MTSTTEREGSPAFIPEAALRAKLAQLTFVSRRPHGHLHTGDRRSRAAGSSIEFADHRRYSPGDDYRQIDWNVYARTDDLFVKVRESEETLVVHLLLDASGSMASGPVSKFEIGLRVLAALGWTALTGMDVLAAGSFGSDLGDIFPPRHGKLHIHRFFDFLNGLQPSGETYLARSAQAYVARRAPHGVAVLVSDLLGHDAPHAIGTLAQHGEELTVIHVLDEEFVNPNFSDEIELVDAEDGGTLELFGDEDLLRTYRAAVAEWSSGLQQFCHRRNVRYVPIKSNWSVEEIVLRHLMSHGVLT